MDPSKSASASQACRDALSALAAGQLEFFTGLAGCTRADAEAALGSSRGQAGRREPWGLALRLPGGPATPSGVTVWVDGDRALVLQAITLRIERPIRELLGEPEGTAPSGLSSDWRQWIWASRGLTAHVQPASGQVITLYGYSATSVHEFLDGEIANVWSEEQRLDR